MYCFSLQVVDSIVSLDAILLAFEVLDILDERPLTRGEIYLLLQSRRWLDDSEHAVDGQKMGL